MTRSRPQHLRRSCAQQKNCSMTAALTDEQRDWLAMLDACARDDGFDLDAFEKLPPSPFPPPNWINRHHTVIGNAYGRQLLSYCDPATGEIVEISVVVIPNSRLKIKSIEEIELWEMYWEPPHPGARKEVTRACSSLSVERHVRANVTRKTFVSWRKENPRSFITERELVYWIHMGVLQLQIQATTPSSAGKSMTELSKLSKHNA